MIHRAYIRDVHDGRLCKGSGDKAQGQRVARSGLQKLGKLPAEEDTSAIDYAAMMKSLNEPVMQQPAAKASPVYGGGYTYTPPADGKRKRFNVGGQASAV
jgi:hypothetical protein